MAVFYNTGAEIEPGMLVRHRVMGWDGVVLSGGDVGVTVVWNDNGNRQIIDCDSVELELQKPREKQGETAVEDKADDDGWIEWKSSEYPPVSGNERVEVRLRDGSEWVDWPDRFAWHWDADTNSDVVAYRLINDAE